MVKPTDFSSAFADVRTLGASPPDNFSLITPETGEVGRDETVIVSFLGLVPPVVVTVHVPVVLSFVPFAIVI